MGIEPAHYVYNKLKLLLNLMLIFSPGDYLVTIANLPQSPNLNISQF